MNKVILIGNLTKDPEIRYSQSAEPLAVARFTLAVSRRVKKEGEPDADFIGCVSFGKQAEFVEKYLKKGSKIGVTGRLSIRSYDDAQGQRRWVTDVITEDVEFVESRASFESRMGSGNAASAAEASFERAYLGGGSAEKSASSPKSQGAPYEPEGFAAITESIDDDDLPF